MITTIDEKKPKKIEPIEHIGHFGMGWGRLIGSVDKAMMKKKQDEENLKEFGEYLKEAQREIKAIY